MPQGENEPVFRERHLWEYSHRGRDLWSQRPQV